MDIAERALQLKEDIDNAYEAGKGAMWDGVQNYGNRTNYPSGFFSEYNEETLSPKYVVAPTGVCSRFFADSSIKHIDKSKFDLSKATYSNGINSTTVEICMGCTSLEVFPDIGLQPGRMDNSFDGCESLHTVEMLRFGEDCPIDGFTFYTCGNLVNINNVEGVLGQGANFPFCPFSIDSMKRIITHLKNYSGTDEEYMYDVWFNYDALDRLDTEGGLSPNGNKWSEYIDDLGWNLL